jgi:hypothetical protein
MHLYRKEELSTKDGYRGLIKTVKNKVFNESKGVTEFDFYYGLGLDKNSSLRAGLTSLGLLVRSGAFYSFSEQMVSDLELPTLKKFQGSAGCITWFNENEELTRKIYHYALAKMLAA